MNPQYPPNKSLTVKYGWDRSLGPYHSVICLARSPAAVQSAFQEMRRLCKDSVRRVMWVAFRPGGWDTWTLGSYRKDKLGRVRWYNGWPAMNGLTQLSAIKCFPGQH